MCFIMNFLRRLFSWTLGRPAHTTAGSNPPNGGWTHLSLGNVLPPSLHQEIHLQSIPRDGRVIIIGDVHGCLSPLKSLIHKLRIEQDQDTLIFVGDLVNKGPDSCEVIDYVRSLGGISVRGNHDDTAIWLYRCVAGKQKLEEKLNWVKEMTEDQVRYLESLPFSLSLPELNLIVVHAGLVPGIALRKQDLRDLYMMRFLLALDGKWKAVEKSEAGAVQWVNQWNGPQHVVFGHDAVQRLQRSAYATGIDTGCVYGGQLAACVIPAGRILHDGRSVQASLNPTAANLQVEIVTVPGWVHGVVPDGQNGPVKAVV